jgi:hypothetical protein
MISAPATIMTSSAKPFTTTEVRDRQDADALGCNHPAALQSSRSGRPPGIMPSASSPPSIAWEKLVHILARNPLSFVKA